jgi:hypothetical protein
MGAREKPKERHTFHASHFPSRRAAATMSLRSTRRFILAGLRDSKTRAVAVVLLLLHVSLVAALGPYVVGTQPEQLANSLARTGRRLSFAPSTKTITWNDEHSEGQLVTVSGVTGVVKSLTVWFGDATRARLTAEKAAEAAQPEPAATEQDDTGPDLLTENEGGNERNRGTRGITGGSTAGTGSALPAGSRF